MAKKVAKVGVKKEKGYLYFIDKDGDVSSAVMARGAKKGGKPEHVVVSYKRRYWNGSAYAYEANWTQVATNKLVTVGQITWKLDTPLLNSIKASNVSLYLKNTDWEWVETNKTSGVFAPTATVPGGFDPFLTKFKVDFGYTVASGAIQLITIFTGVAVDYVMDTKEGHVEVQVSGNEYLLQAADAQALVGEMMEEAA